jgi:UDP-galactopyranose mutase
MSTQPNNNIGPITDGSKLLPTMIVFCHLRWDFVYQRPQQLLSRMAQYYRILVVEEPFFHEGEAFLKSYSPCANVTVIQPHTNVHGHGFSDEQMAAIRPMLKQIAPRNEDPVVWFYTPMALPLLQAFTPSLVVYDCMDELSAFKNAPPQLLQRESALLSIADLVFTGGPSLYEAKRQRHDNAHCFSSSVDIAHFSKALERSHAHPSQANLAQPRLGFYGVIDERFDVDLLRAIADARPEWQLVMVGPVVKIDPASLPKNPNIHYMGQAGYDELPQYLAAWQVCLMPFALNESTKFISPTKVLEYMAAELPVVSTNITDVTRPYGHVVSIAHTAEQFIAACDAALALTAAQKIAMVEAMRDVVAATSWDATVDSMVGLMHGIQRDRRASHIAVGAASKGRSSAQPVHAAQGGMASVLPKLAASAIKTANEPSASRQSADADVTTATK